MSDDGKKTFSTMTLRGLIHSLVRSKPLQSALGDGVMLKWPDEAGGAFLRPLGRVQIDGILDGDGRELQFVTFEPDPAGPTLTVEASEDEMMARLLQGEAPEPQEVPS